MVVCVFFSLKRDSSESMHRAVADASLRIFALGCARIAPACSLSSRPELFTVKKILVRGARNAGRALLSEHSRDQNVYNLHW